MSGYRFLHMISCLCCTDMQMYTRSTPKEYYTLFLFPESIYIYDKAFSKSICFCDSRPQSFFITLQSGDLLLQCGYNVCCAPGIISLHIMMKCRQHYCIKFYKMLMLRLKQFLIFSRLFNNRSIVSLYKLKNSATGYTITGLQFSELIGHQQTEVWLLLKRVQFICLISIC